MENIEHIHAILKCIGLVLEIRPSCSSSRQLLDHLDETDHTR